MAQANGGAAGANGNLPQAGGALIDGARIRGAGPLVALQAGPPVAAVAGPFVAPVVAGAIFPQGLVHARFDVDGVLLGPLPRKSNGSCKILPKIPG